MLLGTLFANCSLVRHFGERQAPSSARHSSLTTYLHVRSVSASALLVDAWRSLSLSCGTLRRQAGQLEKIPFTKDPNQLALRAKL